MMNLRKVQDQQELQELWPWACPWIDKAIGEEGNWTELGAIKSWLMQGALQMWIAEDGPGVPIAFLVTEVLKEAEDTVLQLRWCGGRKMEDWLHLLKGVEQIAMWNRVSKIEISGRKGWEKALKPYGYEFKNIVLGKRLDYSRTLQ